MAPMLSPAVGAVALAVAAGAAARRLMARPLPRIRGTVAVTGVDAPVRIRRDRHGVPQVLARTVPDAAFGMGYVHAQDRLWQLDFTRRVALGRLSEIAGAETIAADRFVRRVGLHRLAAAEAEALEGEGAAVMNAYCAGINSIIATARALPLEFLLTRSRPGLWQPRHCLAITKLVALGLSVNWDNELQRLELLRALGPERAARVDLVESRENLADAATESPPPPVLADFTEAARWFPTRGGCSNSWVVSGARTASGRPLLCNDPHLPPSAPGLWYAAHVVVENDFETTGATLAGMPFPIIGHNRRCAWGYTNSFADAQDLVIEEFDDASGRRHRTESGTAESQLLREVIRVKGAPEVVEDVVVTRHGPVVDPIVRVADGRWRGLALQWTANQPAATVDGMLRLQRASDWDSFRRAFANLDAPSQNVVYADIDGHIGYILSGRIPVRRRAPSGLPIPGWTGDALWERHLGPDEVPQLLDPPDGIIVTANNRIVGDDFPHYIANDYMNGYRAARIRQVLAASGDGLTPQRMVALQQDLVSVPGREVAALLGAHPAGAGPGEELRRRLSGWDGVMDPRRSEPTAYHVFLGHLAENTLQHTCGPAWGTVAGTTLTHPLFGYPGNLIGRLTPLLIDRWRRDDPGLFAGTSATWHDVVNLALEQAASDHRTDQRWGRAHSLSIVHRPLGEIRALAPLFNAGTLAVGGDSDTVFATSYSPAAPFRTTLFAPSWRQVVDVGSWESSTFIHYPGQSGQLGSRHRRDLVRRWVTNRQLPLPWGEDGARRPAATLVLIPETGVRRQATDAGEGRRAA